MSAALKVTAAVVEQRGAPFTLEQIDLDSPGPGEVLVEMVAVGVCHTDVLARDDGGYFPFPCVLGHEGAGIVAAVGPGVTRVDVGAYVVLSWPWCGRCRNCVSGQPKYCANLSALCFSGTRPDGTTAYRRSQQAVHGHFFGQSSFSTHAVVWESCVIPVRKDARLEILAPLGCGISTGAGAVINALHPAPGSGIAIFGAGAVGLSAVMAAKLMGCTPVIAVDVVPARLDLARALGATDVVDATDTNSVEAVRDLAGKDLRYSVECTGNMQVLRQAVEVLAMRSTCAMTGAATTGTEVVLNHRDLLRGKRLVGILGGAGHPDTFVPELIALHDQGLLPIDRLIQFYDFADISCAIDDSVAGTVLKPVLRMNA